MNIAFATDRNYLDYALVAIASLLEKHPHGANIYILHGGLTESDLERFEVLKNKKCTFNFFPVFIPKEMFSGWPILKYSIAAYYRLALPEILPELDRVIYLDCDLLVLDDIEKLWNIDIGDYPYGATSVRISPKNKKSIGMDLEVPYLNSGVMIFNLKKMRQENYQEKFLKTYDEIKDKLKYIDQDILNYTCNGKFYKLPLRWNLVNSVFRNLPNDELYSECETRDALANPGIAHFTGTHKPWLLRKTTTHPYAWAYRYFAKKAKLEKSFLFKMFLKSIFTSKLKRPKTGVPWNSDIVNYDVISK